MPHTLSYVQTQKCPTRRQRPMERAVRSTSSPADDALDTPLAVFVRALPIVLAALTWLIWEVAHRHGRNALPPSAATVAAATMGVAAWRVMDELECAGKAPGVAARVGATVGARSSRWRRWRCRRAQARSPSSCSRPARWRWRCGSLDARRPAAHGDAGVVRAVARAAAPGAARPTAGGDRGPARQRRPREEPGVSLVGW